MTNAGSSSSDLMKKLISILAAVTGHIDLRDVIAFGGLGLLGYGLHAIYPPAAFVTVGSLLFWIGSR